MTREIASGIVIWAGYERPTLADRPNRPYAMVMHDTSPLRIVIG